MRLQGVTVLVTRAMGDQEALARLLRAEGATVHAAPSIRVEPRSAGLAQGRAALAEASWAVFTSPHGVQAWHEAMGGQAPWPPTVRIAAVGTATRKAAEAAGWPVAFVPRRFTAEALGDELPAAAGERVVLLRAQKGNPVLAQKLRARGADVVDVPIYDTVPDPGLGDAVAGLASVPDWLVFASPSAAEAFEAAAPPETVARLRVRSRVACMGPTTTEAARRLGYRVAAEAEPHTLDGLVRSILEAHPLA